MLQERLVDLASCLLSQGLSLMKDIISQFAKKTRKAKFYGLCWIFLFTWMLQYFYQLCINVIN